MTYQINEIPQTKSPKTRKKGIEISRAVIKDGFTEWLKEVEKEAEKRSEVIPTSSYRNLKKYHQIGLNPIQTVTKICT